MFNQEKPIVIVYMSVFNKEKKATEQKYTRHTF